MKKIATVSVLAIMAVSAARADIASTTYVDKTAAGAVTTGLSETGNITAAIKTATTGMATQTWVTTEATAAKAKADADGNLIKDTYALKSKVGEVDLATTTYMKNDSDLTAAVKSLDTQLSNVAGGNLAIKSESITATEIKDGAVGTNELANGSVTEAKLGDDVKAAYVDTGELNTALQPYANNTAGYQTAAQVSTAITTATTDPEGVIKKALDGKVDDTEIVDMAKKSDIGKGTLTVTIDGADAGTFNANAAENGTIAITVPGTYVNETELETALKPYADNDAGYQNADQVSAAISTATTSGVIKTALDGKVDDNEISDMATKTYVGTQLGDYYTKTQADTLLADKQDTTTAVTHTANTAVGDTTHAVYIDSTGAAQRIEKVASALAADSATTATDYNETTGKIKEKFDGVDTSLEKVSAFGDVPDVPAECVAGTADCTLVIGYTAETGMTHTWEKIAR